MATAARTMEAGPAGRTRDVRRGDRVFRRLTLGSGLLILALIVAIATFLVWKALPAFRSAGLGFLTEKTWFPDAHPAKFGTAVKADREWPKDYGVLGDYVPNGFINQLKFPFTWKG